MGKSACGCRLVVIISEVRDEMGLVVTATNDWSRLVFLGSAHQLVLRVF